MLTPHAAAAVETIRPLLRQCALGEFGAAIGGAHAKSTADHESDLDLYVFAPSVLPDAERTRLALMGDPRVRDVVSWSVGDPFEQAGTDFFFGDLKVECWFRSSEAITCTIDECGQGIVRRDFVTWTTTGFYNHCCLSDIKVMVPIDDPVGMLSGWKQAIGIYPPKLREAIIREHLRAARFWPGNFHYTSAVERADVIYTTGIVHQVVHNLIQVLFAANRVYFPGDKKLEAALAHLEDMPDRFAERVRRLLAPEETVTANLLRQQQRDLQDLLAAVNRIVERSASACVLAP